MYEILKPDFCYKDDRGSLVQLVHDGWRQINVVFSKEGTVRGGHYHRKNREAFYIMNGSCELTLRIKDRQQVKTFKAGDFFAIEPGTVHTFSYLEDTLSLGLYDLGVEEAGGYWTFIRCRKYSCASGSWEVRRLVC